MRMLHRCSFPTCVTFTVGTYCYEHQRFVRDEQEAERVQAATREERVARELSTLHPAGAPGDLPPAA